MITISIDEAQREFHLSDIDEQWIAEQLRNRRKAGQEPCIKILIKENGLCVLLATQNCPSTGGSRQATAEERNIILLWKEIVNVHEKVNQGEIISFLKRLREIIP